jgi:hypothetical protein
MYTDVPWLELYPCCTTHTPSAAHNNSSNYVLQYTLSAAHNNSSYYVLQYTTTLHLGVVEIEHFIGRK